MNSRAFEFLSDVVERSKILDYFGSSKHSSAQPRVDGRDRVFFPAETTTTCPDPCTGLKKMSFWCSDDPCKIGQGDSSFKCECEVNAGAVVGIVIGCIVAVCIVGGLCFFCYLLSGRRQAAGIAGNTTEHVMQQHVAFGGAGAPPAMPGSPAYGVVPPMMGMPQQAVTTTTTTTTNYAYNPNPAVMVPAAGVYGYGGGMTSPPPGQNPTFMQQPTPVMGAPLATTGYGYAVDTPPIRGF